MERDWRRNNKRFFNEFEKEIEQIDELVKSMMQSMGKEPHVYGFSINVGPDGIPHIERFGNMMPFGKEGDVREPFTSSIIDEKNDELKITAEMPGVNKEDIELNVAENEVVIKTETENRKYCKYIPLQTLVDPEKASAKYNNGVLEITIKLKESKKPEGKSIKID